MTEIRKQLARLAVVSGCSLLCASKAPKAVPSAILCNFGAPLAAPPLKVNAFEWRWASNSMPIGVVFAARSKADVFASIVEPVTVAVVNVNAIWCAEQKSVHVNEPLPDSWRVTSIPTNIKVATATMNMPKELRQLRLVANVEKYGGASDENFHVNNIGSSTYWGNPHFELR